MDQLSVETKQQIENKLQEILADLLVGMS